MNFRKCARKKEKKVKISNLVYNWKCITWKIKYNKLLTFQIINSLINLIKILYQILEYFLQYPHKYMVKFGRTSLLLFIYFVVFLCGPYMSHTRKFLIKGWKSGQRGLAWLELLVWYNFSSNNWIVGSTTSFYSLHVTIIWEISKLIIA